MHTETKATIMLAEFCDAVAKREGARLAALFTEDGVYHDAFYGPFAGRERIAQLIDDWFYRTAQDFRWQMHNPVSDGRSLYAYYTFSYRSLLPEAKGARVGFDGVAMMQLRDGLISEYREAANVGTVLVAMNFAPERVSKILAREGQAMWAQPLMQAHLK